MTQRSGDMFLGVPWNISAYSLLTHMFAHLCDLEVNELSHLIVDSHIYLNHIDQVKEQILRTPQKLPTVRIKRKISCIDDFKFKDFELSDYKHLAPISAPMAI